MKEKEENILQLERSVTRMEGIVAAEAKVKEEVEDEVVEVEVEEMMEEFVKEKVEEKVVEEKAVGARQWLRGLLGTREAGAIQDLPWDRAILAGPGPPNLDYPLLIPPESPVRTLRFFDAAGASKDFGAGKVGMGGPEGGGPPGQAPAGGGGWWWQPELPGRKWGEATPPRKRG